ncbi:MAG: amidohydrolase family protein [Clostridia bacterium]|nr:amidohydrolase family protein [Clostridia bacterium]
MKIIDAHCHVYPDKIAVKASQATGRFYSIPMNYDGTVSTLLEVGERAGVDEFIIQSVATTPAQVKSINDFIKRTVDAYPDKMHGLGTLHPDSADLAGDVEHIIELGLHGVKLHPDIQAFKLDDYRCLKIYELCEKKGLPILIHTGDSRYDYSNPNRLMPILDIYENLTIIGAHFGGWSIWDEASQLLWDKKNFYVDCSSSFFALSDEKIVEIIHRYGADRVLFGSDYPMWNPLDEINRLNSLDLTQSEKEKIFALNAEKLFLK